MSFESFECECSEDFGPCELHCEYLVTREGASLRTADELCLLFLEDAGSLEPLAIPMSARELVLECEEDMQESGSSWLTDVDLADALRDTVQVVESRMTHSVYWEDGYVILTVTGGPMLG